jgi:hypothetical protein
MREIGDRTIDTEDGSSIVREEEASEGSYGRAQLHLY